VQKRDFEFLLLKTRENYRDERQSRLKKKDPIIIIDQKSGTHATGRERRTDALVGNRNVRSARHESSGTESLRHTDQTRFVNQKKRPMYSRDRYKS